MDAWIDDINRLRGVRHRYRRQQVRKVVVILSSPRSGSTLFKTVLATHPALISSEGEIEPLLVLTRNGYGFNSDSDALGSLHQPDMLADLVLDTMTMASHEAASAALQRERWLKRLLLHFPAKFRKAREFDRLRAALDYAVGQDTAVAIDNERAVHSFILSAVYGDAPRCVQFYDGFRANPGDSWFDEREKIEEPPFVLPRFGRRNVTDADLEQHWLLLKTPPDAFRLGMYEQLFPEAEIRYIHLTRGYAQSVNGLIDGWQSQVGFFSHEVGQHGVQLRIDGYSDRYPFGARWWKFDMPPNWRDYLSAPLLEVCLNQWLSAQQALLASGRAVLRIAFEQFLRQPADTLRLVTDSLGIAPLALPERLPVTMATDAPTQRRWLKREAELLPLIGRADVRQAMQALDYGLDPLEWI